MIYPFNLLRQASDTCRGSNAATFAAYREDIACREGIWTDRVGIFLGALEHHAMKPFGHGMVQASALFYSIDV